MFSKKCNKCNKKVKKDYDYCPFCGNNFTSKYDSSDYGILGKNDSVEGFEKNPLQKPLIDKLFNKTIGEIIPSMIKKIERQIQEDLENPDKKGNHPEFPGKLNVQLFVNGKKVTPEIKETHAPKRKPRQKKIITQDKLNKLTTLPKKEPSSKLRRLSGKIIYELEVPGVNSLEDIFINQLENSIEIKAMSDKEIYAKNLKLNLPIIRYYLNKGNLYLEFAQGQ